MSEQWPEAASSCSLDGFGDLNIAQELVCEQDAARELLRTFVEEYAWDVEHPKGGVLPEISSNSIPESLNHHLSEPLAANYSQLICASYTASGKLIAVRTPLGGNNAGQEIIDKRRYFVVVADLKNPEAGFEHWETTDVAYRRSGLDVIDWNNHEVALVLRPYKKSDETSEWEEGEQKSDLISPEQKKRKLYDMAALRLAKKGIIFCPRLGDGMEAQLAPVRDLVLALGTQQRAIAAEQYVKPETDVKALERVKREQAEKHAKLQRKVIGEQAVSGSAELTLPEAA